MLCVLGSPAILGCSAGTRVHAAFDALDVGASWRAPHRGTDARLQLRFAGCPPVDPLARQIASLSPVPEMSLDNPCDLDILRGTTGLRELSITLARPLAIDPLRRTPELRELHIHVTDEPAIVDVSPLAGHPALALLDLQIRGDRGGGFVGVEQLHLPALQNLFLREVRGFQRIDWLAASPELAVLDLMRTDVTDLDPLAATTALMLVDIRETGVVDIAALARSPNLTTLNARGARIRDLEPLRGSALHDLGIGKTAVHDLRPLATMTGLQRLDLLALKIRDLGPLARLTRISHLNLAGTGVTDCSVLAGLPALNNVDLRDTPISSLECLRGAHKLRDLALGPGIVSLEPLRDNPNLARIFLTARTADTLEVLRTLPALENVLLDHGSFTDEEIQSLRRNRRNLRVEGHCHARLDSLPACEDR